ncbi:MAG: DUF2975 domain-containing protein [Paludibacter sp.]
MKRIKIFCIILLAVFFGSIYQGAILPFVEGMKYGISVAKYQLQHKEKTDDFVMLNVVTKDYNYLDASEINLKTGEKVLIRPNNMTILIQSVANKPAWWIPLQIIYTLLIIAALVLSIWIPFLVVKIIRSLQNSQVFDRHNLKRINRIGIIMLIVGLLGTATQAINIFSAQTIINLAHYNFSYSKTIDFNPIIMGVVILIMNEILRIGTEMKEEQDLTI